MGSVAAAMDAIDHEAASQIARLVGVCPAPQRKPWGDDTAEAVVLELLVSTLSHAMNEDKMVALLRATWRKDGEALSLDSLAEWTPDELTKVLGIAKRVRKKDDPDKLAALVSANFGFLRSSDFKQAVEVIESPETGCDDFAWLVDWLATFPAFSDDPLQKKSSLFLQRVFLQGYFRSRGVGPLIPFAVDRHIVRLLLRLGWVTVDPSSQLAVKVRERRTMNADEDYELRSAVLACLEAASVSAGVEPPLLNYVLWQFGRSYCSRYSPGCASESRLIGRGAEFETVGEPCIFAESCESFKSGSQLSTLDPVHRSQFY